MKAYYDYLLDVKDNCVYLFDTIQTIFLAAYERIVLCVKGTYFAESDIQINVFYGLMLWLGLNLVLILLTWTFMSSKVVKMLTPNGRYKATM